MRYKSEDAIAVCGVTARQLDYWVATGVITPTWQFVTEEFERRYHIFSLEDLIRIKMVKTLRDSEISLEKIRSAVKALGGTKAMTGKWLDTDGNKLYTATPNPTVFESLAKKERGQLVFSFVAVEHIREQVTRDVANSRGFQMKHFKGKLKRWKRKKTA